MRLRMLVLAAVVLFLVPMAVVPAHADTVIDFGSLVPGGTVSYAGGTNPLVGVGLNITSVVGIMTPSNPGSFPVSGGLLSFTTGNFSSFNPVTGYTFNGGGTISITGGVAAAGIAPGTLLVSGSFLSAVVSPLGAIQIFLSSGPDTKNAQLLSFFGLAPSTPFNFSGSIFLNGPPGGGGAFSQGAFSVDIANVVTEPGTLVLLGAGLMALAAVLRHRYAQ